MAATLLVLAKTLPIVLFSMVSGYLLGYKYRESGWETILGTAGAVYALTTLFVVGLLLPRDIPQLSYVMMAVLGPVGNTVVFLYFRLLGERRATPERHSIDEFRRKKA